MPFEIVGKYAKAMIYTDNCESEAQAQILEMCNQPFVEGAKIRIMPDVHAGKGCTIGTTMTIKDRVCPNLVGVDIGCGVICVNLGTIEIDFSKLDNIIRKNVPAGMSVHSTIKYPFEDMEKIRCFNRLKNVDRLYKSLGTLGGGNHFIEVGKAQNGDMWLFIHTGSRNLGKQVAEYYQFVAAENCNGGKAEYNEKVKALVNEYKAAGRQKEIEKALENLKKEYRYVEKIPKDLCYLESTALDDYLHDVFICQEFANINRESIARIIIKALFDDMFSTIGGGGVVTFMGDRVAYKSSAIHAAHIVEMDYFTTIHNYIDRDRLILRKGAVAAENGQRLIIPMNMRDGVLICVGKGNSEWNYSAPHGAGRLMSRSEAKKVISLEDFKESMKGIFTTTVDETTIDESAFAYKPADEIKAYIGETVTIVEEIKPVYNFKASE